jgi:hypothetical protein
VNVPGDLRAHAQMPTQQIAGLPKNGPGEDPWALRYRASANLD